MLAAGNNDITSLSLSPIRSRKGSFDINREQIKKENVIDSTQNYNLNASFNSEISAVQNVFDIEFDGNNENNISMQSDKKDIDRCFFDDDVSNI